MPASEDWICDRLVEDWNQYNSDISTKNIHESDIIWLLSDWRWKDIPKNILNTKKVVTTVHHIVPRKFDLNDFLERDKITTLYHVYNEHTYKQIKSHTTKQIKLIPYWVNQNRWEYKNNKEQFRRKFNISNNCYAIGSFQRDTEGHDLRSPKLEKGPDLLIKFYEQLKDNFEDWKNRNCIDEKFTTFKIILGGWRRQYMIENLKALKLDYSYYELPKQEILNELYQSLDLYSIAARYEGGPQALLECGALNVPTITTPVGIAEQVLPKESINQNIFIAKPNIPSIMKMKLPNGFIKYREMFKTL